ncbi:MAG: OmpA family protein [Pseudomonadota bacterium]
MKKISLTLTISVFLLLTLFMTLSIAEDRQGAFTVTPNIGWYFFEGNQNLDDGITSGLNLGYDLTKNWGIEGSLNYIDSGRENIGGDVEGFLYKFDALYNITNFGKLVPYLAAGVGGITLNPDRGGAENDFLFNYGAGLKYFITDNVALRGDVRHILPYGSLGKDDSVNNLLCTVGVSFLFGGEKETPKVEAKETPKVVEAPKKVEEEKVVIMASEPKVEEKVMAASVEPKIIILAFEDIHFGFDQSILKPEAKTILKRNIQLLKENPKAQIRIAGYTSASGTEPYNQKLSERRANAVREYLINEGVITRDRLSTIGYGETSPEVHEVAPKKLYSKAAKANMRVLFEIIVK